MNSITFTSREKVILEVALCDFLEKMEKYVVCSQQCNDTSASFFIAERDIAKSLLDNIVNIDK